MTAIAVQDGAALAKAEKFQIGPEERAMLLGDLGALQPEQRASLVVKICESVGLNPLTRPLEYIVLNNKLTLYARKDATDQLRAIHNVSINIVERDNMEGVFVVTARAKMPSGRCDESIGAVPLGSLKGEAMANAIMKAETKAKRRVTLSICGLGMLDEAEIESIPNVQYPSDAALPVARPATPRAGASRQSEGDKGLSDRVDEIRRDSAERDEVDEAENELIRKTARKREIMLHKIATFKTTFAMSDSDWQAYLKTMYDVEHIDSLTDAQLLETGAFLKENFATQEQPNIEQEIPF